MSVQDNERRLDAERAVLGSMLIDESCVAAVLSRADAQDFLSEGHRRVFQAIRSLFRDGRPVDPFTVRSILGQESTELLAGLVECTASSANAMEYVHLMHEQAALARVQEACEELQACKTLEEARPLIARMGQSVEDRARLDLWSMSDVLDYFRRSQTGEPKEYISTGMKEIDRGSYLSLGDVLVIAGEPSAGKTAFALIVAMEMAKAHRVGFFSLETRNEKLADRLVAGQFGFDFGAIKQNKLTEKDWTRFAEQGGEFAQRDLKIIPASGMTASSVESITRACGFEIIFIDYAQLLTPEVSERMGGAAQMADISRRLHTFAQRSGVMVVELLQLSRPQDKKWREPTMHDLKETGQWEQDADCILMLYLPDPKDEDYDQSTTRFLKIAKNKEGRRGNFPLYFDGSTQTFTVMAGPDSAAIQRQLTAAGKAYRQKQRLAAMAGQVQFRELSEAEGADVPWKEETCT